MTDEKIREEKKIEIQAVRLPSGIPPTLIPARPMSALELIRTMREDPNFRFVFPDEDGAA